MAMEWPASSWISPGAALFLFCNVLVGAIVVTSSRGDKAGARAAASTRRLCRSASSMVLGRLRSFSMFAVPVEDGYHPSLDLEAEEQQPQPDVTESAIPTAIAAAASAASPERAKKVAEVGKDKPVCSEEAQEPVWQGDAQQSSPSPAVATAAAEATAVAERAAATVVGSIVQRARACRREFVEEALEGKAALNARAELFIQQFREDLKLQRLNSIINYTRALRRGAGSAAPTAGE